MGKTILIAVLDWGLGHATRMVPVIDGLIRLGNSPILVSSGAAAAYLRTFYPKLRVLGMPAPEVVYGKKGAGRALLSRAIRQGGINKAQQAWTNRVCLDFRIDAIISDNVYGAYAAELPSVLITHQLGLMAPIFKSTFDRTLAKWLHKFDEVWIPDMPGADSLAGEMTRNAYFKGKSTFIGRLSRLEPKEVTTKELALLALVSGPEPQRGALEAFALDQFSKIGGKKVLVRGRIDLPTIPEKAGVKVYDFLDGDALAKTIQSSAKVICRSGYSTLCDLMALGVTAYVAPTPQQPEQIYLAERCASLGWFAPIDSLSEQSKSEQSPFPKNDKSRLDRALKDFVEKI